MLGRSVGRRDHCVQHAVFGMQASRHFKRQQDLVGIHLNEIHHAQVSHSVSQSVALFCEIIVLRDNLWYEDSGLWQGRVGLWRRQGRVVSCARIS